MTQEFDKRVSPRYGYASSLVLVQGEARTVGLGAQHAADGNRPCLHRSR